MIWSLPFISALIGWVTNFLAIKMLFHPRKPINILGIKIQGVFPKRHQLLATKIGALVGEQLFSFSDIKGEMQNPEHLIEVHKVLDEKVDRFLREKLGGVMPMLAMFINDKTVNKIKEILVGELNDSLPDVINAYADKLEKDIDITKVVEEKVAAFSMEKLENVLFSIMSKEFKFIEIVGAILGFIIGVVQLGLIQYM